MPNYEDVLNRLADASDEELNQAAQEIKKLGTEFSAANSAPTEENVATVEGYLDALKKVTGEQTRRSDLADRAASAFSAFSADEKEAEPNEEKEDEAQPESTEEKKEDEKPQNVAVTASSRRPLGSISKTNEAPSNNNIVKTETSVHGNVAGFSLGQRVDSKQVIKALAETYSSVSRVKAGKSERHHVVRVTYNYPEERQLTASSAAVNDERLRNTLPAKAKQQGLTAALCGPLEPLYDINVLGVTNRPIRDALTGFQVTRGGITYRAPFDALTMTTGLGVWTPANDDADPFVPKGCYQVTCPGTLDASLYATYMCMEFPNFSARFDEEWVEASTEAALVAHARFSENSLLARLLAGSKQLTAPLQVSAARDILTNIDKSIAYYRNRHRLDEVAQLRIVLPRWVKDLMRADVTRGLAGDLDALNVGDAEVNQWFAKRNVSPIWHLDGLDNGTINIPDTDPAQSVTIAVQQFYDNAAAGSVIPDFPTSIEAVLFAEGDWLYLDGGTLDLGLVRDSTLNSQNRYQTFVENFEGVAFRGIESLRLTMAVEPTGWSVGTIDPPASDVATYPLRTAVATA